MEIEKMQRNVCETTEVLKTMAHPERLMVLCKLTQGEIGAGALQEQSSLSQSAFSQHLSILRKYGLVKTRKEHQQVFYSLADPKIGNLLDTMESTLCK